MMAIAVAIVLVATIGVVAYLYDAEAITNVLKTIKEKTLDTLASPRRLVIWGIIIFLLDLVTGATIMTQVNALSLANQLTLIVLIATLLVGYLPAKYLHNLIYTTDDVFLVVLNPVYGGYFDIVRMSPEVRDEYDIKGADELYRKPVPLFGKIHICWTIRTDEKEILSTWKAVPDPMEIESEKGALKSVFAIIDNKFDDWREDTHLSAFRKKEAREDATVAIAQIWDEGERVDGEMTLRELYDRAKEEDVDPGEVTISLEDSQKFTNDSQTGGEAA